MNRTSFDYTRRAGNERMHSDKPRRLSLFDFERGEMSIDYNEKGKIFTEVVSKIPVFATIQTTTHRMRGKVHFRRDQRVKDELDREEGFLALTEVTIFNPDGTVLYEAPFLALHRAHIVWVIPEPVGDEERGSE